MGLVEALVSAFKRHPRETRHTLVGPEGRQKSETQLFAFEANSVSVELDEQYVLTFSIEYTCRYR